MKGITSSLSCQLANAPSTFQSLMNEVFRQKFWFSFDDILMYSKGREKHRDHVEQVFQCLKNHRFIVNGGESEFGKDA